MAYFLQNELTSKDQFVHIYKCQSKDELDQQLHRALQTDGYTLKEGVIGNGTYTKGNRIMRLLLGAFVKYFKFHVVTNPDNQGNIRADFRKATSGMSGGLIGMNQVKKELTRLGQIMAAV